ncbi:hypothetical protein SDC9_207929 [bioreactor metagenome]|uniref:Uncharacterized protein n=1 Tax=bioreactor metagenome TaxID=1076179 RepID=A0A645JIN6_9ZZZZ
MHVYLYPADHVDKLRETVIVDHDIVKYRLSKVVFDRRLQQVGAAVSEGVVQFLRAVVRDLDARVARQRYHAHVFVVDVDSDEEYGIGAARSLYVILPHQEDIESALLLQERRIALVFFFLALILERLADIVLGGVPRKVKPQAGAA